MNTDGLLVIPQFENTSKYLIEGNMTKLTNELITASEEAKKNLNNISNSQANRKIVQELVLLMQQKTKRLFNHNDERKFKRTAHEILQSGERTGCCDSSTLFVALARAQNIPSMQIITFNKEAARKSEKTDEPISSGHFFQLAILQTQLEKVSGN